MKPAIESKSYFFCAFKPKLLTTNSLANNLKSFFKFQKLGFSGILDRLAQGVVVFASHEATKFLRFLPLNVKVYIAEGVLGYVSESFDMEYKVKKLSNDYIDFKALNRCISYLSNTKDVLYPISVYSAKKYHSKPLYYYVRNKNYNDFVFLESKFKIFNIQLLNYKYPAFKIKVVCYKGCYIRSIIHKIGQILGCGAVMTSLLRIAEGPFTLRSIKNYSLDNFKVSDFIYYKDYFEKYFYKVYLSQKQIKELYNKGNIDIYLKPVDFINKTYCIVKSDFDFKTYALCVINNSKIKIERSFV